jgi:hypothetical protein
MTDFESKLSVEDADTILATVPGASMWADIEADQKDMFLTEATIYIQLLLNPPVTLDDELWATAHMRRALALQAWFLLQYGPATEQAIKDGIGSVQSKKMGGISATKFGAGLPRLKQYHPQVLELLRGYYSTSKTIVRG